MNDKLDRIIEKLEKMDERIDGVDKTLVKQEANLSEHMRRTEAAETAIEILKEDVKPITRHVAMMEGALKLVGVLALIGSLVSAIFKMIP